MSTFKSIAFEALRLVQLLVGLASLTFLALLSGLNGGGLATVSLVHENLVYSAQAGVLELAFFVFLQILGILACSTTRKLSYGSVDARQLLAGCWLLITLVLISTLGSRLEFEKSTTPCLREACFPSPYQEILLVLPVGLAALSMIVVSFFKEKITWWVSVLIPTMIFGISFIVQRLFWDSVVLEFLTSRS